MNFKVVIIIPRGPYPDGLAEKVRELGLECELYHRADNEAELISMCRDADYIMTTVAGINYPSEVLNKLEKCKFIYTISVGYDGRLYDCDFNQMLGMQIAAPAPASIYNFDLPRLLNRRIRVGRHCFGCTAGGGSS